MDLIEVVLLNYRFKFRRLFWKEEFELDTKDRDGRRVVLATALVEVSGLMLKNFDDAWRVLEALPTAILHRVFIIYKGKQPETRAFTTRNLYKAPETTTVGTRIAEEQDANEKTADVALARMEQQFGKQEIAETAELDRQILEGARNKDPKAPHKFRGAVRKYEDEEDQNPFGGYKVRPNA
jgi:hypothetical protein